MNILLLLLLIMTPGSIQAAVDPRAILCVPTAAPCVSDGASSAVWCVPVINNSPANKYIVSLYQTNTTDIDAPDCLGRTVTEKVCIDLKGEGKFECDSFWRSGMSGGPGSTIDWTSPLTIPSLKESILEKSIVLSGQCARTLIVNITADTLAII